MSRMLDLKSRSRMRKIIYGKPMIIVLAVVFFFIASAAWGMYGKSIEANKKLEKADQKLTELESREKQLTEDILLLSTDRGVEGEIRDRFMVAKEGENVMIITDPEEGKVHTVTITDSKPSAVEKMISAVGISN